MALCMWAMAKDILEHPISQVKQYDALWKSLCQGRKAGRWEGYSCFTKSTNCSQTQKCLSTGWLQKEFNIPFSRVNDADQRSCVWRQTLSCPLHLQTWRKKYKRSLCCRSCQPSFLWGKSFFFLPIFFRYIKIVIIFIKGNAQLYLHCKTGFKKGKTNTE